MGIETICEGGMGGSAVVYIQLRNSFPGLGGIVTTEQDFTVAYRVPASVRIDELEQFSEDPVFESIQARSALHTFLRHAAIKKLDDYFFRKGEYRYSHIPRPLGSTDRGGYIYEWVHGTEGFYTEYFDDDLYRMMPVEVDDWNIASQLFNNAGVGIFDDIVDAEDGRYTKNMIMQEQNTQAMPERISKLWKRIDFGAESMTVKYDQLAGFVRDKMDDLIQYLGRDRARMLELVSGYLTHRSSPERLTDSDEMCRLVYDFRQSTASHMGLQELRPVKRLMLFNIKDVTAKKIRQNTEDIPKARKELSTDGCETLESEIRSSFPCIDGMIHTMQEIQTARLKVDDGDPDAGFKMFLRHFIAKKLENAFITRGDYSFAHIPRPLGSEGDSYSYEWMYGDNRCPREFIENARPSDKVWGLDGWYEFVELFAEAGIDMQGGLTYRTRYPSSSNEFANQIVIKQPMSRKEPDYISRMWRRVNFYEQHTPFDLGKLEQYLQSNEHELKQGLKNGRYETMLLAVRYLKGESFDYEEFCDLKNGIHKYRMSTLWHLNHAGFGAPPQGVQDIKLDLTPKRA